MTTFNDRKRGEEAKYSMDAALEFKVTARRNKLTGLWAAELLGLVGEEANVYAKSVVMADLEEPGDDDVIRKILGDFEVKGISVPREDIIAQLDAMMQVAIEQVGSET